MTRTLTQLEIKKIKEFANSVSAVLTPWQPSDSQQMRDANVPKLIKKLLFELVALSSNDHLVDYAKSLEQYENQEDILHWLEGIKALNSKMTKGMMYDQESLYSLYRNIYRVALYLGRDTNLIFASNALHALSQLSASLTKEELIAKVEPLKAMFHQAQANKPPKQNAYEPDYSAYVYIDEIVDMLQPKPPRKPLLYRSRSDSAALDKLCSTSHKKYEAVSPLTPVKPRPLNANMIIPRKLFVVG